MEQVMFAFLWANVSTRPHKKLVACSIVTKPKNKRGLDIKRFLEWNKVALLKHVWHIITDDSRNAWMD